MIGKAAGVLAGGGAGKLGVLSGAGWSVQNWPECGYGKGHSLIHSRKVLSYTLVCRELGFF